MTGSGAQNRGGKGGGGGGKGAPYLHVLLPKNGSNLRRLRSIRRASRPGTPSDGSPAATAGCGGRFSRAQTRRRALRQLLTAACAPPVGIAIPARPAVGAMRLRPSPLLGLLRLLRALCRLLLAQLLFTLALRAEEEQPQLALVLVLVGVLLLQPFQLA